MNVLDCAQLRNKPNGNGQTWSGCIPGAIKFPMWKPATTVSKIREAVGSNPFAVMIHNEKGVDHPANPNKADRQAVVSVNNRIAAESAIAFPGVDIWAYKQPCHLHGEWFNAWQGDKAAAQRVKECTSYNAEMVALGYPGKGVSGVVVDLYDYEYMAACWEDRAVAECGFWTARGFRVLPIVFLRFKASGLTFGRQYTRDEAQRRIEFAARLGGGSVAIFDVAAPNEQPATYADWVHRELIESLIAKQ